MEVDFYFSDECKQYLSITISPKNFAYAGSAKANGREPKSCLGQVFNFKLGHFVMYAMAWSIQKHALA